MNSSAATGKVACSRIESPETPTSSDRMCHICSTFKTPALVTIAVACGSFRVCYSIEERAKWGRTYSNLLPGSHGAPTHSTVTVPRSDSQVMEMAAHSHKRFGASTNVSALCSGCSRNCPSSLMWLSFHFMNNQVKRHCLNAVAQF